MLTGTQKSKIRAAVGIYRKRVALLPLIDGSEDGASAFRAKWSVEDHAAYESVNNGHDFVVRGIVERVVYGSAWRA